MPLDLSKLLRFGEAPRTEPSLPEPPPFYGYNILPDPPEDLKVTYRSYSGSDTQIYLLMNLQDKPLIILDELQTLSISTARGVFPVRRIGESHVTEYSRGARTIAGSMIFTVGAQEVFSRVATLSKQESVGKTPLMIDQIPEFALLIHTVNEYGQGALSALTGVTITNFGLTHSVDDMFLESSYTYVAKYYHPMLPSVSILKSIATAAARANDASHMATPGMLQPYQKFDGTMRVFSDSERRAIRRNLRTPIPPNQNSVGY